MTRLQKYACSNLIMMVWIWPFTALLTLMIVKVYGRTLSVELVTRHFAMCTYGVLIITAITTRKVFRMRKEGKEVYYDERDKLINYRAVLCAYYAICILLAVGLASSVVFLDEIGLVPFYALPTSLGGIALVVVLVYSVAVLIQYGRGGKEK